MLVAFNDISSIASSFTFSSPHISNRATPSQPSSTSQYPAKTKRSHRAHPKTPPAPPNRHFRCPRALPFDETNPPRFRPFAPSPIRPFARPRNPRNTPLPQSPIPPPPPFPSNPHHNDP